MGTRMTIGRILLAGLAGALVRLGGQLLIPASEQGVLAPGRFGEGGLMLLLFTLYAWVGYSVLAAIFLLVRERISGSRLWQGLKYGFSLAAVWTVYSLEPLPHMTAMDHLVNPLAGGLALMAMAVTAAFLLGFEINEIRYYRTIFHIIPTIAVGVFFFVGRVILFEGLQIYSSYMDAPVGASFWAIGAGLTVALAMNWYHNKRPMHSRLLKALFLGGVMFGVNLLFMNFFMPIVFEVDIADLLLRTGIDVLAVTLAALLYRPNGDAEDAVIHVPQSFFSGGAGVEDEAEGEAENAGSEPEVTDS